jgi:ATP-dependent DNA ligase
MLASTTISPIAAEYAIEPKLDGWRVVVHVDEKVRVLTRPGRDATASVPELAGLIDAVPRGSLLRFDGGQALDVL